MPLQMTPRKILEVHMTFEPKQTCPIDQLTLLRTEIKQKK